MKIAIIGSAGRRSDGPKVSRDLYIKAFCKAKREIEKIVKRSGGPVELVSGGAAFIDHLAVSLFLDSFMDCSLTLHLPCPFDMKLCRYEDDGSRDFRKNPGGTCNYYHKLFSQKMGGNTLSGIKRAIDKGASIFVGNGFFDRNKQVAKCDHMLAFTFGTDDIPKDGGTRNTWDIAPSSCVKTHISLASL